MGHRSLCMRGVDNQRALGLFFWYKNNRYNMLQEIKIEKMFGFLGDSDRPHMWMHDPSKVVHLPKRDKDRLEFFERYGLPYQVWTSSARKVKHHNGRTYYGGPCWTFVRYR